MDSVAGDTAVEQPHKAGLDLHSDKWQRISPASVIYFAFKFITSLVRNGLQAVAPVAAVLATAGEQRWFALGALAAGAAVLLLIGSVLSYLNFKFRIDKEAFLIRSGVLTRKRLTLGFDRIQNVAFREPLYFRPFGLVILTLESAGSTAEEVNLAGIPRPLAETIRRYVLDQKKSSKTIDAADQEKPKDAANEADTAAESLLRQPFAELAKYGVTNNNIWVFAGIAAGALAQVDELWESGFMQAVFNMVGDTIGTGIVAIATFAIFMVFLVLLILMLASVLGAIIVNYNYHLSYADGRYHRTRGLFERQETSVPEVKVQSLKVAQPLIARFLDRFHLTFNQVGFDGKQSPAKRQKFVVPSVTEAFYNQLAHRLFGKTEVLRQALHPISPKFVLRHAIYTFGVPSLLISGLWAINVGVSGLIPAIIPLVLLPFIVLRWRRYGYASDGHHAVVRKGLFGLTLTVFPFYKVQTISISQSPGQRAAGLANLKVKLAGHSLTIPYMPIEDARAWRAAALTQVETQSVPWM